MAKSISSALETVGKTIESVVNSKKVEDTISQVGRAIAASASAAISISTKVTTEGNCKEKNTKTYKDYMSKIGDIESTNNYQCVNEYGYMGRYQMGSLALIEAGYMDSNNNWTEYAGSMGVYSRDTFLNSSTAQDDAFYRFNRKQWTYIVNYGLDSYIGKEFNATGVTITPSGLLAACHLVGVGDMNNAFINGTNPVDANGTQASRYMELLYDYDISEVMN